MGENQLDTIYIQKCMWMIFKFQIQRWDNEWKMKTFQMVLLHNEFSSNVLNGTDIKVICVN